MIVAFYLVNSCDSTKSILMFDSYFVTRLSLRPVMVDVCNRLQTIQSVRQCQAVESGFHQKLRIQNIKESGRHQ